MTGLSAALHALTDLVFPPRCLVCLKPPAGREPFCAGCDAALFRDPYACCPRCAARVGPFALTDGTCSVCRAEGVPFEAAFRLGPYDGPLRDTILRIKTSHHEYLAELLGERLADAHADRLRSLALDAVIPVPLHWWRRLRRGYNQSAAVARGVALRLRLPCRAWALLQVKRTKPQKTLSAAQRRDNVRGAFRAPARLDGAHLLLVDDVMTTGATAAEASRALRRVGARVSVAVLRERRTDGNYAGCISRAPGAGRTHSRPSLLRKFASRKWTRGRAPVTLGHAPIAHVTPRASSRGRAVCGARWGEGAGKAIMLRYSLVLVVGLSAGPMLTQARAATWAHVLFDEVSKDFGSVPRGPLLEHRFRVVNRTNSEVNISTIKVACGCVKATMDKMSLKPGEETVIYTTMDSTRFVGPKSVTIFVTFDRPQAEEVRLTLQANGRNDYSVSPETLTFGQVKRGTEALAASTVTFQGHTGAKILAANGESNYLVPYFVEKRRTDHEVVYELGAKLRSDTPVGKWYTDVWVETNVTTMPKIRVPLTVEVESALTVSPSHVALGEIRKGDESVRRVIVRGVKPFKITTVHGSDAAVEVLPPSSEDREVHVITVKVKAADAGVLDRTLRVVTDLKEDAEIDFKVSAAVKE